MYRAERIPEGKDRGKGGMETEIPSNAVRSEMVAHKYSYGIPEARKTSIPAEAHVCPCAFGNFVNDEWREKKASNVEEKRGKLP